jgi:predicted anti-sigma-YlaC factor YlaD
MSHQPFEPWLLNEANPSPEQEAALQAHLATCQECRQIRDGWLAARQTLQSSRMARPAPGFSERFNASLAERRALQAHRRQIRNLILGLSLGLIICAGLLAVVIFTTTSPVNLLVKTTEGVTSVIGWWNQSERVVIAALQQPVILVVWILLTSGVSLLAIGWLFTLWRISLQGAQGK